jgi:very-short-patch-repair endonuclease
MSRSSSSSVYSRRLRAAYRSRLEGHAARMRVEATPSEALLWSRLLGSQLGVAFRRQVVLGEAEGKLFVVDFLAPKARLVVEVDGGAHSNRAARDERRDAALSRLGYRVLRLPAELVERRIEEAVRRVQDALFASGAA